MEVEKAVVQILDSLKYIPVVIDGKQTSVVLYSDIIKAMSPLKRKIRENSNWGQRAQFRKDNEKWLDISFKNSLALLEYMHKNSITKERLMEILGITDDTFLNGSYDFKISEITKIEKLLNENIQIL